ncbi:flagellar basal body L-ring protein FlgH [Melioribacteraceae bacterium 4301-Me]|uniref:flagellar basal body L-ring protein FlgH n=1 Tax=Pyranulibacter aquaticus TaxID=3163344 RepID=UPI00359AB2CA
MKHKNIIILSLLFTTAICSQNMSQNAGSSLFSDYKASRVGDAITIIVVESSQASNNAETKTGRSSNLSLSGGFDVNNKTSSSGNATLSTGNDFSGSGSTKTVGVVKTKISATIDSVLSNGNLVIKGSRKISINGEEQMIYIKGIVRPSDIAADNSVLSYNISEAEIVFEGSGIIDNAQKPGWLTKLFHWLF